MSSGTAPGKAILFGEHAAVYGHPAIAAALSLSLTVDMMADPHASGLAPYGLGRGAFGAPVDPHASGRAPYGPAGPRLVFRDPRTGETATFDASTGATEQKESVVLASAMAAAGLAPEGCRFTAVCSGDLPLGVGLGSSAAFSIALLRALGAWRGVPFTEDELLHHGLTLENVFHGRASGVDHTVATLGGCVHFVKGRTPAHRRVAVGGIVPLVVACVPRIATAGHMVAGVAERRAASPVEYDARFAEIAALTAAGECALATGDLATLGRLFDLNHGHLRAIGVSVPALDALVERARAAGALGAKLTGAGGGGSVLAVFPNRETTEIYAARLRAEGIDAFATTIAPPPSTP